MQLRQAAGSGLLSVAGSSRLRASRRPSRAAPLTVRAGAGGDNHDIRQKGHGTYGPRRPNMGKTAAAAAAAASADADTVDNLMLKLAALGSAALGADPETAAALLASSAEQREKEKQPRRMKLLRAQVTSLLEKQQQLEDEMSKKEQEFREVRAQLAQQAATAAELAQAKEEAELAANRMRSELSAAQHKAMSVSEQAERYQEKEKELEVYKEQLKEAWDELQHERMHREELRAEIGNAEKAAGAARQLAVEVKDLQATVTAALKRKQAEGAQLQEQLTKSVMERARLEEMLGGAEQQAAELAAQLQEASDERGIMQQRALYLQTELESTRALTVSSLDGQAAVLAQQLQEANTVAEAAKALVLAERQRNSELQSALEEAEAVRQQLQQQSAAANELTEQRDEAEAAAVQMQADVEAAQDQAARYQQQAEEIEAFKQQLKEAANLRAHLEAAVSERDRLEARSIELEAEVASLRSRSPEEEHQGQPSALIAQLKAAQKDASAKQSAIQSAVVKAADLQAQLTAAVREREKLQERSSHLEAQLTSARSASDQDQDTIRDLTAEVEQAQRLALKAADLECQLAVASEERARLAYRASQLESQLSDVTTSAQQRQQELEGHVTSLLSELEVAQRDGVELSHVRFELAAAEQQAAAAASLAQQLEEARQDLSSAKALAAQQLQEAHHVAEAAKALVLAERERNALLHETHSQEIRLWQDALGEAQQEAGSAWQAQQEEQHLRLSAEEQVVAAHEQVQHLTAELFEAQTAADQLLDDLALLGNLQVAAKDVMAATRQEVAILQQLEQATERVELLHSQISGQLRGDLAALDARLDVNTDAELSTARDQLHLAAQHSLTALDSQLAILDGQLAVMDEQALTAEMAPADWRNEPEYARALSPARHEAEQLVARAYALACQLEQAQREAQEARADAQATRSRNNFVEKAWVAALESVRQLQGEQAHQRKKGKALESALASVQRDAASLAAQLQEARQESAAAMAQASAAVGRNSLLEKAWAAALQDSRSLKVEQRELKATLKASQRQVSSLSAKLDSATAQLEAARREAQAANKQADVARSRSSLLQQAWESALRFAA